MRRTERIGMTVRLSRTGWIDTGWIDTGGIDFGAVIRPEPTEPSLRSAVNGAATGPGWAQR